MHGKLPVQHEWVSERVYRRHLALFPKVALDIVAMTRSSEFVLVKRNEKNNEWKGSWATPGGRVYRNEKVTAAAHRILKRETGILEPQRRFEFRGFEEVMTPLEHGVTLIFRVRTKKSSLRTDESSSDARWFTSRNIPADLKNLYHRILTKSGVFN